MTTRVTETPTTPTPSSFHPEPAPASDQQSATPKPTYNPSSTSSAAQELRHVTSHPRFTTHTTTSKSAKLAPLMDGQKTPSGLSPNHIPTALNLSPSTHPARMGSRSSSSIPSSPNSMYVPFLQLYRMYRMRILNGPCAPLKRYIIPCGSLV
jgi:hypothetical protein